MAATTSILARALTNCQPCSTSELDLSSKPPVQSAIIDDYEVSSATKSTLDGDGPLEFQLISSGDDLLDLSECYLNIEFIIRAADGTVLNYLTAAGDDGNDISCQPINNIIHSMFKRVDLIMNEKLISSSGDNYPYRAYLTNLLSYKDDVKKSWLSCLAGWHMDEAGRFSDARNSALRAKCLAKFRDGRTCQLRDRLHLDMIFQGRLIPNNVNLRIILTRSSQHFFMMSHVANQQPFQITLQSATLDVRRVRLTPEAHLNIERVLSSSDGAMYPITQCVVKTFNVPQGSTSHEIDSLLLGQMPNSVILGLVSNAAYNGQYTLNPFDFGDFGMTFCALTAEGKTLPAKGLKPDVANNKYLDCLFSLMKVTGPMPYNWSNSITPDLYKGGCFLLGFDLTPDGAAEGVAYFTPKRYGTVKANFRFREALAATVTVIVFAQYDNIVAIDSNRAVTHNYTV